MEHFTGCLPTSYLKRCPSTRTETDGPSCYFVPVKPSTGTFLVTGYTSVPRKEKRGAPLLCRHSTQHWCSQQAMADNTVGQRTIYEWEGRWRFRPSGYTTQLVAFLLCYSFPRKHMGVDPNDLDLSP